MFGRPSLKNKIFVLDTQMYLNKLKQTDDDNYETLVRIQLNDIKELKRGMDDLIRMDYPKISIQDRSLTIKGKHYIYKTGLVTPVDF